MIYIFPNCQTDWLSFYLSIDWKEILMTQQFLSEPASLSVELILLRLLSMPAWFA
jgi:hypothetical protein